MVATTSGITDLFESLHARAGAVDLADFIRSHPLDNDDALAELIELDGRLRIAAGLPVQLERYLTVVPGLRERLVALDAAIDMSLRGLFSGGAPTPAAVGELRTRYPEFADLIDEAAQLSEALCATQTPELPTEPTPLALPCEI